MGEEPTDPERKGINEKILEGVKAFPGGEQRLQECDEKFQVLYAAIPEGGKFEFLKDWFCKEDGREDQGKAVTVEQAEKKNEKSAARGQKVLEWTDSDAEAEERERLSNKGRLSAEARRSLEWTEYDSEAEREEAKRGEAKQ